MVEVNLSAEELERIGQWYELVYASGKHKVVRSDLSLNLKISLMAQQLIQDELKRTGFMDDEE
tara:strand:- start:9 stop:197 length:189 start_codon:yes stop_codon:yes gene_type:complete